MPSCCNTEALQLFCVTSAGIVVLPKEYGKDVTVYVCTYLDIYHRFHESSFVLLCFVLNLDKMDLFSCLETINGNVACGVRNPKRRTVLYTITYSLSRKEKVVIYK